MKVPFSWLKELVDIDVTAQELEEKLFSCGFEVEELPGQLKNARCEKCARKAWGATYRIKAKNNRGTTDQSRATVK